VQVLGHDGSDELRHWPASSVAVVALRARRVCLPYATHDDAKDDGRHYGTSGACLPVRSAGHAPWGRTSAISWTIANQSGESARVGGQKASPSAGRSMEKSGPPKRS
jgi:hypothetical protein